MTRRRSVRAAACAAFTVVVLAGCGVPAQEDADPLGDQGAVALLEPQPASRPGAASVPVYFVRAEELVPVPRAVSPLTVEAVVQALIAGPSRDEAAAGLHSSVGPSIRVGRAAVEDSVARIDLSSPFAQARSEDQVLAVAQFVYTVTGLPGVEAVAITVDGEPIEVPTREGAALKSGPLRRTDFPELHAAA